MDQTFAVAVKAVIQNSDGKILLLYKSDSEDINPNSFDIPGGRIKRGEKLEDAIKREVEEETGLQIQIQKISRTWGFTKGDMYLIGITYLCSCIGENVQLSDEHTGYYRLTPQEIIDSDYADWIKEEVRSIVE